MKKIILLFTISCMISYAQNSGDASDLAATISLSSYLDDDELSSNLAARKLLETKLNQIVVGNAMEDNQAYPRFIITGTTNVLFKEILGGAPTKFALTVEVSLYIGDRIEGAVFAREILELNGVGNTEEKALISAIKKLSPRNKLVASFVNNGKQKIIDYYSSTCDFTLRDAELLAEQRKFDEAIHLLTEIPEVCKECFDKSMALADAIVNQKFEYECNENIAESRYHLSNGRFSDARKILLFYNEGMDCYNQIVTLKREIDRASCSSTLAKASSSWAERDSSKASRYLSQIPTNSPCYSESLGLANRIANSLDEENRREWEFQYEKYKDEVTLDYMELNLEAERIQLIRDIGLNYGISQQPKYEYVRFYD